MATLTITQKVERNLRSRGVAVLNRKQWGAKFEKTYAYRRRHKKVKLPVKVAMQHITVTLDHGPLTGDFKKDVRTVEQIGMDRFGSGISYNFIVDMETGMVAIGQPLDAAGAHTVNDKKVKGFPLPPHSMNYTAIAIAVLGMPDDPLSKMAKRAIVHILAACVEEGALINDFQYFPHSKFASKDCPCDPTRSQMSNIRRAVTRKLKGGDSEWKPL